MKTIYLVMATYGYGCEKVPVIERAYTTEELAYKHVNYLVNTGIDRNSLRVNEVKVFDEFEC